MSDEDLMCVNVFYVFNVFLGGFIFGLQIDGDYVQNWLVVYFWEGQFDCFFRLMFFYIVNEMIKFLLEEDWGGENNED